MARSEVVLPSGFSKALRPRVVTSTIHTILDFCSA